MAVLVLMSIFSAFISNGNCLYAGEQHVNNNISASQRKMCEGNNDFACNLFRTINEQKQDHKSIIVSPISVSYLLGMLNAGADGETCRQITNVLGLDGTVVEVNEYFKKKMNEASNVDPKVTVKTANCIYVNSARGIRLIPQYKADMLKHYNAEVVALDFRKKSSLNHINDWCKTHTNGMIPSIYSKLEKDDDMYLLNAVYFKAPWTDSFNPSDTHDKAFTKQDGTIVKHKMMHLEIEAEYGENDLCEVLCLPYGNRSYSIYVLLPHKGKTIDDVIQSLTERILQEQRRNMTTCEVDILIPRFTTESETDLTSVLSSMGMPLAPFPKMAQGRSLGVSQMKQKAKIKVSEEGTEAAAVTEAEISIGIRDEPRSVQFHATRPFVYYIVERSTSAIYFIGTYCGD